MKLILCVLLSIVTGWNSKTGFKTMDYMLVINDGESMLLEKKLDDFSFHDDSDILLSPDSAFALYGELGKNGAHIRTKLDASDPSLYEDIYATENVKQLSTKHQKYKDARWAFYMVMLIPFVIVLLINLLVRNKRSGDDCTYTNIDAIPARTRVFEYIIDFAVLRLSFQGWWQSYVINHYEALSLFQFSVDIPIRVITIWVSMIIIFTYYFCCEYFWGKTVGKWLLKMRVVDVDRKRPTVKAITIRTICRLFSLDKLSCFLLFGKPGEGSPQLWHDQLSKTMVISDKEPKDVDE